MITNNSYIYNVLQYKHSEFAEEAVNIGVLLYWPETNDFIFKYSKNLIRVKNLYKNFSEKIILEYLKILENKCLKISSSKTTLFSLNSLLEYDEFIATQFLFNNNNALQFTNSIKSINYFENPEDVLFNLIDRYFIHNDFCKEIKIQKEAVVLRNFNNTLESLGLSQINNIEKKYIKNKIVTNETGNKIKFDIAWKNGSLNLIKPINFDLNDQKTIADKSYKNYGLFTDLENEAIENNYRYDLMVLRPQNSLFYKDYDHAIKLLSNLKKTKIVEESGFETYAQEAYTKLTKSLVD